MVKFCFLMLHIVGCLADPRVFTATLFPYIPDAGDDDFQSLKEALEDKFEEENPDIDLQLTFDPSADFYDFNTLQEYLGPNGYDMVEIDTLLLGSLVSDYDLPQVLPWESNTSDFYDQARISGEFMNNRYGVPTYLCGYWIYSWDEGPSTATGEDSLSKELNEAMESNPQYEYALIGNFIGSWTFPGIYLDAYKDTYTDATSDDLSEEYQTESLDSTVMQSFSNIPELCDRDNNNKCLDGSFKYNILPQTIFGHKYAAGHFGYSETLFTILNSTQNVADLPYVVSAPFGKYTAPVMFVDALVLNKKCQGDCLQDAETFSNFMSRPDVRELIAFSEDVTDRPQIPRYLMMSTKSFYETDKAKANPIYQVIHEDVPSMLALPNWQFPENKDRINGLLLEYFNLTQTSKSWKVMDESEHTHGKVESAFEDLSAHLENWKNSDPKMSDHVSILQDQLKDMKNHVLMSSMARYRFHHAEMWDMMMGTKSMPTPQEGSSIL